MPLEAQDKKKAGQQGNPAQMPYLQVKDIFGVKAAGYVGMTGPSLTG